jgi:hypothetical protein
LARQALGQPEASKLKPVAKSDPRRQSSTTDDTAERLYGKRSGSGKADPSKLQLVPSETKITREGGRDLLPEYRWRLGLEERPDLGEEVDPDVDQPTWGDEDPILRKRKTGIERGMDQARESAIRSGRQQLEQEGLAHVANMSALTQEAEALDAKAAAINERRARIADLQRTADQRAEEASKVTPRTHGQVWDSKSALAKLSAIIGMAFSGYSYGTGRAKGNLAWEMVQKVIDDEVNDEKDKAQLARNDAKEAKGALNDALTLYGDLDAAALDSRLRKISNVRAKLAEQQQIKGLDQNGQQVLAQLGAAAEQQYLETQQQLYDKIGGVVTKQEVTMKPYGEVAKSAHAGGGGTGAGGRGRGAGAPYGMSPKDFAELTKENRKLAVKLPNGNFKFVRDPTVRAETQDRLNATTDMLQTLRQIEHWGSETSSKLPWAEKRGKIEAATSRLLELSKRKDMLGALDKGLLEFSARKYGNPESLSTAYNKEVAGKLAQQVAMLENEQRGIIERDLDDSPLDLTEGGISAAGIEQ